MNATTRMILSPETELYPLVSLRFCKSGIEVLDPGRPRRLRCYLAFVLEAFVGGKTISAAHTFYLHVLTSYRCPKQPMSSEVTDCTAVMLGNKLLVSPTQSADLAYDFAAYSNAHSEALPAACLDLLEVARIADVSHDSQSGSVVRALADSHAVQEYWPKLTFQQFLRCASALYSTGFLTVPRHKVNFGDLRRHLPFCPHYGYTRGTPIDRYYLDRFVDRIKLDVIGTTLEVGGRTGNHIQYGFVNSTSYATLDLNNEPGVDVVGDAHNSSVFNDNSFDSIVLFNVLEHCPQPWVIVGNIRRWLRPGGKVFCMVPNAQRIHRDPQDYWRILPDGMRSLFASFHIVEAASYGNFLTLLATFAGLAVEEFCSAELNRHHPCYPVITCLVAQKQYPC